jgi:hypothetical protein
MMGVLYYQIGSNPDVIYGNGGVNNTVWRFNTTLADGDIALNVYEEVEVVTTLDEKYIPDTIARKSDIPDVPTKLSEFENDVGFITADDIPEGGGGTVSWDDIEDKPFSEIPPLFDITWDGNMDGHDTVEDGGGNYLVKVSDDVYTAEQVLGAIVYYSDNYNEVISEDDIYTDIPGTLDLWTEVFLVYSADELIAAMGLPEGSVSNGVWVANVVSGGYYVNRFVAPHGIQTIDEKYIPDTIARTSDIPEVPTKVSELENDAGFITADDIPESVTSWNDLEDKPFGESKTMWNIKRSTYSVESKGSGEYTYFITENNFLPIVGKRYKIDVENDYGFLLSHIDVCTNPSNATFDIGTENDPVYLRSQEVMPGMVSFTIRFVAQSATDLYAVIYEEVEVETTLDEKYIPYTIARKADIPTIPSTDELVESVIASLPIYNGEVEEV